MQVKNGDTVRVHYTGKLDDGTVFDSSRDGEPLEATLGEEMLIPGFERALLGLSVGDTITVSIAPEDAYGQASEELLLAVPRDKFPAHLVPEKGIMLQVSTDQGEMDVRIADVTDEEVILDANHPLAGQTLTFELELMAIL